MRTSENTVPERHPEEYARTLDRQRVAFERFAEATRISTSRGDDGERRTRDDSMSAERRSVDTDALAHA